MMKKVFCGNPGTKWKLPRLVWEAYGLCNKIIHLKQKEKGLFIQIWMLLLSLYKMTCLSEYQSTFHSFSFSKWFSELMKWVHHKVLWQHLIFTVCLKQKQQKTLSFGERIQSATFHIIILTVPGTELMYCHSIIPQVSISMGALILFEGHSVPDISIC